MKLRHDPFQIFHGSKTPAGLYARQKWLDEADRPAWQTDFKESVKALFAGQSSDGSWHGSSIATIRTLFGLHLTVRSTTSRIEDAMNWLLNKMHLKVNSPDGRIASNLDGVELKGLPFARSRQDMLLVGATLFLCSIFNRHNDPPVLAVYEQLKKDGWNKERLAQDITSMHNIFRALVVHPVFARKSLTTEAVAIYADLQREDGEWGTRLPFFQAVNALAHLNLPAAEAQLETAFARVLETQNQDGTWGSHDCEWNTFLCIHALKNKDLL